jgi:hypothetical protein
LLRSRTISGKFFREEMHLMSEGENAVIGKGVEGVVFHPS